MVKKSSLPGKILIIFVLLLSGIFAFTQDQRAFTLWYNKPASQWIQALPLGNGKGR